VARQSTSSQDLRIRNLSIDLTPVLRRPVEPADPKRTLRVTVANKPNQVEHPSRGQYQGKTMKVLPATLIAGGFIAVDRFDGYLTITQASSPVSARRSTN
jgi:hypothetical protein